MKIKSKKVEHYIGPVYDLGVNTPDVSYVVNNKVVHNSAGGSLVARVLGITEIDPIKHGLYFERFLDVGRVSLPDIDIDIDQDKRHLVKEYLESKYGKNSVASIGSFNTMAHKQAIKDLCRGLDIPIADANIISKIIDSKLNVNGVLLKDLTWQQVITHYAKEFTPWVIKYPKLFELLPKTVGHIRHHGVHASGVVVNKDSLIGKLPLRFKNEEISTQFDMHGVEDLGFVKIDLLGLRTLSTLTEAMRLIKERHGDVIDHFYDWSNNWEKYYEDKQVWDDISSGNNLGIFQLETSNLSHLSKRFKPKNIDELAALVSVCRPGISRTIDEKTGLNLLELYLQKRDKKVPVVYKHPKLKEILGSTLGTFVYQEQAMKAAVEIAGYSLQEADRLRKMIGKSQANKMKEEREIFVSKSVENGTNADLANSIFDELEKFGQYGFNLSHALGYSFVTYWCLSGQSRLYDWDKQEYLTIAKAYKKLKAGEVLRIASYDEKTKLTIPNTIKAIVKTGKKESITIYLKSNKKLVCSKEHRILTDRGWVEAGQLTLDDKVASEKRTTVHSAETIEKIRQSRLHEYKNGLRDKLKCFGGKRGRTTEEQRITWDNLTEEQKEKKIRPFINAGAKSNGWHKRYVGPGPCEEMVYSYNEYLVCDFLTKNNLEHDHQPYVGNGKFADFTCQGVYIEYDGMEREQKYFDEKYKNDESYVVIKSRELIEDELHFLLESVLINEGKTIEFESIKSIEITDAIDMYDLEMEDDPHNFLANNIVVHNCAYLKTHYPHEFMTALFRTNPDGAPAYTKEARRLGISVLGPDINESGEKFTLTKNNSIRYGLESIKFISGTTSGTIEQLQPFSSMPDFIDKLGKSKARINKRAIYSMISVGAFDSLSGDTVSALRAYLRNKEGWLETDFDSPHVGKVECELCHGTLSRFDCLKIELNLNNRAANELANLGSLVTINPLHGYTELIRKETTFAGEDYMITGEKVIVGGLLSQIKPLITKKGKNPGQKMAQIVLDLPEDDNLFIEESNEEGEISDVNSLQIVVFPSVYKMVESKLEQGTPVLIKVEKLSSGLSLQNIWRLDLLKSSL